MENPETTQIQPKDVQHPGESPSQRVRDLREALSYYRGISQKHAYEYNDMRWRFISLDAEKKKLQEEHDSLQSALIKAQADMDSQVKALQSKIKQKDSELGKKDRLLKEREEQVCALKKSLQEEEQRSQELMATVELDQKLAGNNQRWRERWTVPQQEVPAEKEASPKDGLTCSHRLKVSQVLQENSFLKKTLKEELCERTALTQKLKREQERLDTATKRHAKAMRDAAAESKHRLQARGKKAAADIKVLREEHHKELELLKTVIRQQEKTMRDSEAESKRRLQVRGKKAAADIKVLREEHRNELELLKKDRDHAVASALKEKTELMVTSQDYLAKLTEVEAQLAKSEADWSSKFNSLKQQLQLEIRLKEDCAEQNRKLLTQSEEAEHMWLLKEEKNKASTQALIDKILHLHELASLSDREKAKREKAERKAREEEAKRKRRKQEDKEDRERMDK